MGFSAGMLRGASGEVDHRLARRALISQVKKGRVSRESVCDAHPELIRAARHIGEETSTPCPICDRANVVLVTYVFGKGLPPSGKVLVDRRDVARLQRTGNDYAAYVVEACVHCRWHHLLRMLPIPGRGQSRRSGSDGGRATGAR